MISWWIHVARQRLRVVTEKLLVAIVWRLPRPIVYLCSIRLVANATTGLYGSQIVPDLFAMDALKRWET